MCICTCTICSGRKMWTCRPSIDGLSNEILLPIHWPWSYRLQLHRLFFLAWLKSEQKLAVEMQRYRTVKNSAQVARSSSLRDFVSSPAPAPHRLNFFGTVKKNALQLRKCERYKNYQPKKVCSATKTLERCTKTETSNALRCYLRWGFTTPYIKTCILWLKLICFGNSVSKTVTGLCRNLSSFSLIHSFFRLSHFSFVRLIIRSFIQLSDHIDGQKQFPFSDSSDSRTYS